MKRFIIVKLMTGLMAFFFLSVMLHGQSEGGAICGTTPCIYSADIINGQVTGTDIQDGSIGGADIAAGSVGTTQIVDGAVTSPKIAAGAVGSSQISDGSV